MRSQATIYKHNCVAYKHNHAAKPQAEQRLKRLLQRLGLSILLLSPLYGCTSKLLPHELTIQQGNVVTQAKVDQLKVGMSKRQVKFILGTPLIVDALNHNEWHYIYSVHKGKQAPQRSKLSIYFENELLAAIAGDFTSPLTATSSETNSNDDTETSTQTSDKESAAAR